MKKKKNSKLHSERTSLGSKLSNHKNNKFQEVTNVWNRPERINCKSILAYTQHETINLPAVASALTVISRNLPFRTPRFLDTFDQA